MLGRSWQLSRYLITGNARNYCGEDLLKRIQTARIVVTLVLGSCMLVFPIAALEKNIPIADYELVVGEESNRTESMELTSSFYTPVSSILITNESVMDPSAYWNAIHFPGSDSNYYEKIVSVPYINVSDLIFTVTASVVEGPLEIEIEENSTIGQTGSLCRLIAHVVPEVTQSHPEHASVEYVRIQFNSTDWDAKDAIYFSIEATFTNIVCPVTIDLQRTNGKSMYTLPEFRTIHRDEAIPNLHVGNYGFVFFKPNTTIYIPNGDYSIIFEWLGYSHAFGNVTLQNESIYLELRIKSTRLDVHATQKIPWLYIVITYTNYDLDWLYDEWYMIKDSPVFYLPSVYTVHVWVNGEPAEARSHYHFDFNLETGTDRNVTLTVNENWIVFGGLAFTPSRLLMFQLVFLIIGTIIVYARRELWTNPIFVPFLLLLMGSLLPTININSQRYTLPVTSPIYAIYQELTSNSLAFDTAYSRIDGSICTISSIGSLESLMTSLLAAFSFASLFIAFLGVVLEIIGKKGDIPEVLFFLGLFFVASFQLYYYFTFHNVSNLTLGYGFFITVLAIPLWFVLSARKDQFQRSIDENVDS